MARQKERIERMKAKNRYGSIGTVSHATMRPEDLIRRFISELDYIKLDRTTRNEVRAIQKDSRKEGYYDTEDCHYDLERLFDILDSVALPYFYFGSHPGDGSDYGFWLSEDAIEEFDGLKVSDLSEIPAGHTGEVMLVNDHGNVSLYACNNGKVKAVWEVV